MSDLFIPSLPTAFAGFNNVLRGMFMFNYFIVLKYDKIIISELQYLDLRFKNFWLTFEKS